MKNLLKYGVLLIAVFAVQFCKASEDSTAFTPLGGNIFSDKTLEKGRYLVSSNLRVGKDATLTIEAGSQLVFNPGTEIVVLGGLNIKGRPNNFVKAYSLNASEEGVGINITGANSSKEINLEYTSFSSLLRPLTFDNKWYRKKVSITYSQFKNINTNDAAILIADAEYLKHKEVIPFEFSYNVFADNFSNIHILNLTTYNIAYTITNNVFYNNSYYDYRKRVKNNPIYGNIDDDENKLKMKFENNILMNNHVFHDVADTLFDYSGFGIEGTAQEISIENNYWGSNLSRAEIEQHTFGFNKDKFAPGINVAPYLKRTPEASAFIEKVEVDGEEYNFNLPSTEYIGKPITLYFSKPLAKKQREVLLAVYLDTSIGKVLSQRLSDYQFNYNNGSKKATLLIEKVAGIEHAFYLKFSNLVDEEGFEVPSWDFGRFYLNKIFGEYKNDRNINLDLFFANAALWKAPPQQGVFETVDPKLKDLEKKKRTFEIGIMNGVTNYFGDLSTSNFNRDEINYAVGLRFRYNFRKRYSIRGMFDYGHLSGNDRHSQSELKRIRNLNFRSVLYAFSGQFEYHLNHYVFTDKYRFIPSISTGVTLFHFRPRATIDGKSYDLNAIGTEGQTLPGGPGKYRLTQLALPVSASLKTMVGYHFILEAEVNFVKTFTDHLDDVSGFYPNIADVQAQNAGEDADAIGRLIKPSQFFQEGDIRGDPDKKDWYLILGVTLSYRF